METEAELDGKALVDRPADKLLEIKVETVAYTLGHVYWARWRTRLHKGRPKALPTH